MKRLAGIAAFGMLLGAQTASAEDFHCPPGAVVPAFVDGNVIVHPGAFCSGIGSMIKGNVVLQPDAVGFHLFGGFVEGSVQSERPQDLRIVGATVKGSIHIKGMRPGATAAICRNETIVGDVIIEENAGIITVGEGSPTDLCPAGARNTIHGSVKLVKNPSTALTVVGNRVFGNLQAEESGGALRVERNSVGQNVQLYKNNGTTTVIENSVGANLQCYENAVIVGAGNVARGNKEGQCAAF